MVLLIEKTNIIAKMKKKKNKVQTSNMTKNINIFTSKNNQHAMKLASNF